VTPVSLADWLAYQERAHPRAIDLGLDRVRAVAERLGLLPWQGRAIIVGGTNGKGSTATLIAALARAAGRRVGLFTSPHLRRYQERIAIDGMPVDAASLVAAFEAIESARGTVSLSFFEWNTLAALLVMRACRVELAVLEVGLGGRLDATNIIDADVAVLTSVDIDHTDWLGPDRDSIGREKAGIFRRDRVAVLASADLPPVVLARARELGARVCRSGSDFGAREDSAGSWRFVADGVESGPLPHPGIVGPRQIQNAAAAIRALSMLPPGPAWLPPQPRLAAVLQRVRLEGRMQRVPGDPSWLLDVAHNVEAAAMLARALQGSPLSGRRLALLGMLSDKDPAGVASALSAPIDGWVLAGIADSPRGLGAAQLRARLPSTLTVLDESPTVAAACERLRQLSRPGDELIVCGSFHTVGPALDWLGL
jgi:dihydrofolate synthase/folylpolyglutamate synthase